MKLFCYDTELGDGTTAKLTDLQLYKEEDAYFLSAKYTIEDDKTIRELNVPKIRLPILYDYVAIRQEDSCITNDSRCITPAPEIYMGFGRCHWTSLEKDAPFGTMPAYFTETVIDEKTHEMTLDEIEKKLGYKVKIVNK